MTQQIQNYFLAVIIALGIVLLFFVIPFLYVPTEQATIFIAIGSLLFSIPIGYFWRVFKQPVLQIKEDKAEPIRFTLIGKYNLGPQSIIGEYAVNRIVVENIGRSAAKNCKAWTIIGNSKERVCWSSIAEIPNATINVKDAEKLNFCAYRKSEDSKYKIKGKKEVSLPRIYFSDEKQLPMLVEIVVNPQGSIKKLDLKCHDDLSDCIVLITSDNSEPIEAKVIFKHDKIQVMSNFS